MCRVSYRGCMSRRLEYLWELSSGLMNLVGGEVTSTLQAFKPCSACPRGTSTRRLTMFEQVSRMKRGNPVNGVNRLPALSNSSEQNGRRSFAIKSTSETCWRRRSLCACAKASKLGLTSVLSPIWRTRRGRRRTRRSLQVELKFASVRDPGSRKPPISKNNSRGSLILFGSKRAADASRPGRDLAKAESRTSSCFKVL